MRKEKRRASIKVEQKGLAFSDVNCYELYLFIPAEEIGLNLFFLTDFPTR